MAELAAKPTKQRLVILIRQLVRDNYENCAQIAQSWVAENDLYENLDGMAVGDAIAEKIRDIADDRARKNTIKEELWQT